MQDHSTTARIRRLLAVLAAAIVLALGIVARADSIRLHERMAVPGPQVELRQIAELTGPHAERLGGTVVATFSDAQRIVRVPLESVRRTLSDAGVNWGLLSLSGYTACEVHRAGDTTAAPMTTSASTAVANVEADITLDTPGRLKTLILDKLADYAQVPVKDLRVTFQERDEAALRRSVVGERYEIEPLSVAAIGRIPLTVRRYEGERVAETLSIIADVEKRAMALVATRTISRGEVFAPASIELREVFLTSDRGQPITDARLLQGHTAATLLREGHILYPDNVASPVLVQRGELVTVRCISGNLVVRTVARAGQEGRLGDQIQVRNDSTRETYLATVTGSREVSAGVDAAPQRFAATLSER